MKLELPEGYLVIQDSQVQKVGSNRMMNTRGFRPVARPENLTRLTPLRAVSHTKFCCIGHHNLPPSTIFLLVLLLPETTLT